MDIFWNCTLEIPRGRGLLIAKLSEEVELEFPGG